MCTGFRYRPDGAACWIWSQDVFDGGGAASVHTLDLDLMLVDHSAAVAGGQSSDEPICYVTLGIIQGALFWAIGQEAHVEEVACKATGAQSL